MRRYSGLLAGCAALLLADAAVAVDFSMATYGTGTAPGAITGGDLDGDGDVDLVTSNWGSNTISVLANNGDGTFAAKVDYAVEVNPNSVQVGDMDGDGALDIVVTNYESDSFSVLRNDGEGAFGAATGWMGPDMIYGVALADFDGSGSMDAAFSGPNFWEVQVRLNDGTGSFAAAESYPAGLARGLVAGDLDGDGDVDLAVANQSDAVSLLFNLGDGTFADAAVDLPPPSTPVAIARGDLDHDGDVDLVTANFAGTLSVLINTGGGAFASAVTYPLDGGSQPQGVTIADLDGDGFADLMAALSGTGAAAVLLNNGDGTFGPAASVPTGGTPGGLFAADLNGDGGPDLAVANGAADNVAVLTNLSLVAPTPFTFAAVTGAAPGATVESEELTVDGAGPINVVDGEYAINGGAYTALGGTVATGDKVKVRVVAPLGYSTATTALLTISGVTGEFRVTTRAESGAGEGDGGGGGGGGLAWPSVLALGMLLGIGRRRRAV